MIYKGKQNLSASILYTCIVGILIASCGCGAKHEPDKIYMETWCPACKEFKALLNDPIVRSASVDKKVVFVFEPDEWATVKGELEAGVKDKDDRSKEATVNGTMDAMKFKVHGATSFDPAFYNDLPAPHIYEKFPKAIVSFPTIVSNGTVVDSGKTGEWLCDHLGLSVDDVNSLMEKYEGSKATP